MKLTENPYLGYKEYIAKPDEFAQHSILDAVQRSLLDESSIVQSAQKTWALATDNYSTDPNYTDELKKQDITKYSQGIHQDYLHNLEKARSNDEMKYIVDEARKATKDREYLDSLGMIGALINLGSNLVDLPLYLGGIRLATGLAPSLFVKATATPLRRAVLGGATEMAVEGIKDTIGDKDRTTIDYALGGIFGAGAAALIKNDTAMLEASQKTMKQFFKSDELEKKLSKADTEEKRKKIYEDHIKNIDISNVPMSVKTAFENLKAGKDSKFHKNKVFDALRVDTAYYTANSKSATMRKIADDWFSDNTLQANKADMPTLVEQAGKIEDQIIDNYSLAFHKNVLDYGEIGFGKGMIKTRFSDVSTIMSNIAGEAQMRRQLFSEPMEDNLRFIREELANRASRSGLDVSHFKELNSLAKSIQKTNSDTFTKAHDILSQAQRERFADGSIPKTDTYMPIMYNRNMAEILNSKGLNFSHFNRFILGSAEAHLRKLGIDLTPEQAVAFKNAIDAIAGKIWKNKHSESLITQSFDDMFDLKNMPDLKDIAKFMESRSPLDYSHKMKFKNQLGEEVEMSFMDLVEKDMTNVTAQYARKMGGTTALEKTIVKKQSKKRDEVKAMKLNQLSKKIGDTYRKYSNINTDGLQNALIRETAKRLGSKTIKSIDDIFKDIGSEKVERFTKELIDIAKTDDKYKEVLNDVSELYNVIRDIRKELLDNPEDIAKLEKIAYDKFMEYRNAASISHKQTSDAIKGGDKRKYEEIFKEKLAENTKDIDFKELNEFVDSLTLKDTVEDIPLNNANNISKARDIIKAELEAEGATAREIEKELVRFDQLVKELQGLPTATDPFSTLTQSQRIMKNLNIARLLGQTGWTMTAELGSTVYESGIKNFMEFSSFKQMFRQFRTGEIDDKLAQEIQLYTGLGSNLNRAIGVNKYDHEFSLSDLSNGSQFESALNKIESFSEKATEATLLFGGVKPLTAGFEMVMAKSILHEVIDISKRAKLSSNDAKFLNEVGISEDMAKRIFAQINKYGKTATRKWSNGHKVTEINFDKWDDIEAQDMLVIGMRRKAHQVVQRSSLGDKVGVVYDRNLFKNNIVGRFFLELKDYMITSYVKQFGRAVERRDAYVMGLMATQAAMLSLGTAMQNYTNFAGNEEKLDKSFEPNNFARTVMGRMPAAAYLPTIADNTARLLTGDTVFNSNRYHSGVQDAFMSMPSVDLASKAGQLLSIPYNATFGGGIKGKDVDNIFGVAPLGNTYGVRTVKEYLRALAEEKE